MRYIMIIIMTFTMFKVNAQSDSANKSQKDLGNTIQCAKIDMNSIACYSDDVDENDDGFIDPEEWNDADIRSKGVIELDEAYNEDEIFDRDGDYRYDGILNEDDIFGEGDYDYPDYDLFDDEEDGAFQ
jgi:hypothetical protein